MVSIDDKENPANNGICSSSHTKFSRKAKIKICNSGALSILLIWIDVIV
jgi:hypothetical protein